MPAAVAAIALMALFERQPRSVRRFLPIGLVLAAGLGALMLARLVVGPGGGLLGSYAGVLDGYEPAAVLRWSSGGGRRLSDRCRPALARNVHAGSRPNSRASPLRTGLALAVPALFLPTRELARAAAVPDAFMALPLRELARLASIQTLDYVWPLVVGVLVCIALLAPRRFAPAIAAVVVVALGGSSLVAQHVIADNARFDRHQAFGVSSTRWLDRAVDGPVAYLDDGAPWWNGVWHQAYWNERVTTVARLTDSPGARIHGGVRVEARADGTLVQDDGRTLRERLAVAPTALTLVGKRLRALAQGGDQRGLALWRTSGPPALSMRIDGTLAEGPVSVTAYDCAHGYLQLTLRAVEGVPAGVALSVDALEPVTVPVEPGHAWRVQIAAPGGGLSPCVFHIIPRGSVATQGIAYQRRRALIIPNRVARFGRSPAVTHGTLARGAPVSIPPTNSPIGYCLEGKFLSLTAGQAESDPAYRGATVANFVAEKGLTCDPPPTGFVYRGFATAAMNVPAGTYPYYAPG